MEAEGLRGPLGRGRTSGKIWLALGGLNGALAVIVLAATAHGAVAGLGSRGTALAEIGANLALVHAALLVALGAAVRVWTSRLIDVAAGLAVAGCVLFSGGLYLDALLGIGSAIVPVGGSCFILAWLTLIAAALKERGV